MTSNVGDGWWYHRGSIFKFTQPILTSHFKSPTTRIPVVSHLKIQDYQHSTITQIPIIQKYLYLYACVYNYNNSNIARAAVPCLYLAECFNFKIHYLLTNLVCRG